MSTIKLSPARKTKAAKSAAKITGNGKGNGSPKHDYYVKDLSLADLGRREIEVAEQEMPGLIAIRAKYGPQKPFKGIRVSGSLHMTIETAVLIETLAELGASVRWASCNIFFDPRPGRRRHRQGRVSGVRFQGRIIGGILAVHARHAHAPGGKRPAAHRR